MPDGGERDLLAKIEMWRQKYMHVMAQRDKAWGKLAALLGRDLTVADLEDEREDLDAEAAPE